MARPTLFEVLARQPSLAAQAAADVLQVIIDHAPDDLAVAVDAALPRYRTDLLRPAHDLAQRLLNALPIDAPPAQRADRLTRLGIRLSEVGDKRAALAPTQEAVTIYRRLAEAEPAAYLPALATALNNLGIRLSEVGDKRAALAPTQEAVTIRRRLAEAEPAAYLPDLAMALWGFASVRVGEAPELPDALSAVQQAVEIYEHLCLGLPAAFVGYLRAARTTQADVLDGLGRLDKAAEIRRHLTPGSADDTDAGD